MLEDQVEMVVILESLAIPTMVMGTVVGKELVVRILKDLLVVLVEAGQVELMAILI